MMAKLDCNILFAVFFSSDNARLAYQCDSLKDTLVLSSVAMRPPNSKIQDMILTVEK